MLNTQFLRMLQHICIVERLCHVSQWLLIHYSESLTLHNWTNRATAMVWNCKILLTKIRIIVCMLTEFVITVISISRHHTATLLYICWTRLFYLLHTFSFHFSILTLYLIWSDATLKLYYCLASRHHKGQIPLDGQRPNQTGPDQTRPDKCPHLGFPTRSLTCLVLAKFHYTGPTRLCRKLSRKNPTTEKLL